MSDTLALERLYDAVVARFATEGTTATNYFGWRAPAQQKPGSVISWVPGDPSGNAGTVSGAKQPGRNPRSLATLDELFTVVITGVDRDAKEDERAQYKATRLLRDAWHRAVYLAAHGTFRIKSEVWLTERQERRYATSLRIVCEIQSMVPDEPLATAPVSTRAVLELDELDQEEELDVGDPPFIARAAATSPIALTGEQTVDDVALIEGDAVLAAGQTDPAENGPYVVASGAWTRADAELVHGFFVHVDEGTQNAGAGFELDTADPITVGTTPLSFVRLTPAP